MIRFWLFVHLLGFTMWLGAGLASMVAGIAAGREDRAALGVVVRGQAAVQRFIIAPGALLVVLQRRHHLHRVKAAHPPDLDHGDDPVPRPAPQAAPGDIELLRHLLRREPPALRDGCGAGE